MNFSQFYLDGAEVTAQNTNSEVQGADVTGSNQPAPGVLGGLKGILPFILIIAIFWFFIIRPQNKKQKETEKMIKALKKGDKVITIGGIHGVVSSTKENTIIVKVDDGAKIEFNRTAIATVLASTEEASKSEVNK